MSARYETPRRFQALPDAVGELGARRLERWVLATLVAALLLAAVGAGVLHRLTGEAEAPAAAETLEAAP